MNIKHFFSILLLIIPLLSYSQAVGINVDGASPDASAILDIASSEKGILIPRLLTVERTAVVSPAEGLLVYDINDAAFYYFTSSNWKKIGSDAVLDMISDNDEDTNIEVEKNLDEDIIHFTVEGVEFASMDGKTFNLDSPGKSTFVGEKAGQFDDGTDNSNSAFGHFALRYNTYGFQNVAIGKSSMITNTNGDFNTGVGAFSLFNNNTGDSNTAIGNAALNSNSSGDNNSALGTASLSANSTGSNNVAIGNSALSSNTSGSLNTAIGIAALGNSTTKNELVAVGDSALYNNGGPSSIDGSYNTAIGSRSLKSNTTGRGNVTLGYQTMYDNISGIFNTAIGTNALRYNVLGSSNVAVGFHSLLNCESSNNVAMGSGSLGKLMNGNSNVAIGKDADRSNNNGSFNTIVGYQAGGKFTNHDKSGNVFLGYQAGYYEDTDNKLYIDNSSTTDPLIYGDFSTDKLRINGELEIGDEYTFPSMDGAADQTMTTDGSGNVTWTTLPEGKWMENAGNRIYYTAGNVGIGTTVPDYPLHAFSNGNTSKISSSSLTSGDWTALEVTANSINSASGDEIVGIKTSVGSSDAEEIALIAEANSASDYAAKFDGKVEFRNTNSLKNEIGVFPSNNSGTSSIFFSEDLTGYRGMEFEYNGLDDKIYLYGRFNETNYGPHISVARIDGIIEFGNGEFVFNPDVDGNGDSRFTTDELEIRGGSDLAEYFDIAKEDSQPQPGMIVSIDPENEGKIMITSSPYDKKVIGIISGANGIETGMYMGQKGSIADGEFPIALSGRVYVLTNSESGNIIPGDFLTPSSSSGTAMKVTDFAKAQGSIIGKALTKPDKKGYVLVLVNLQ